MPWPAPLILPGPGSRHSVPQWVPQRWAGALLPTVCPLGPWAGFLSSWIVGKAHVVTSGICHGHRHPTDGFDELLSGCSPPTHPGIPLTLGHLTKSPNDPNPGHHAFPQLLPARFVAPRHPRTEPGPIPLRTHFTHLLRCHLLRDVFSEHWCHSES